MLSLIKAALSTYTKLVFSGEQRSHSTLGGNNRVRKNNNSWQKQSVFFPVGRVKPPVFAFGFFLNFSPQTAINCNLAYPKSWKREEEKQHILMRKSYLGGGSLCPTQHQFTMSQCAKVTLSTAATAIALQGNWQLWHRKQSLKALM